MQWDSHESCGVATGQRCEPRGSRSRGSGREALGNLGASPRPPRAATPWSRAAPSHGHPDLLATIAPLSKGSVCLIKLIVRTPLRLQSCHERWGIMAQPSLCCHDPWGIMAQQPQL